MASRNDKRQPGEAFADGSEIVNKRSRKGSSDGAAQTSFHGSGIQNSGHGDFTVMGNVNITANSMLKSEEANKFMRQLFVTDASEDRNKLKRKKGNRAKGTCEWILKTDELTCWLGSKKPATSIQRDNILWLHGNPGTGKSTMAIFLTEELSERFSTMENNTLIYFFCDASFEQRRTATSIIRGLLYQLVQKHPHLLLNYVLPRYKERGDQIFASFDALWKMFAEAAADQSTGQKYCIIDALDECDRESQQILLYQLKESFDSHHHSPSNIQILITSRPYREIQEYLADFMNKDLASFGQARQDIDQCIKERVDELVKRKHYTAKVEKEVSDILREKAEGTFLWIGLACEELREKSSKDAIRFLKNMPKGLMSLYSRLLETAIEDKSNEGNILRRILSFVAVSFEVLSLLELSNACKLHVDEQDVDTRLQYTRDQIASCRLLVVIQDEKVQLLHQSVRDFLVGDGSRSFINKFEAHSDAACVCIDFLISHFNSHHTRNKSQPFFEYATHNWTAHARAAQDKFRVETSHQSFFEDPSPCRESWLSYLPSPEFIALSVSNYEHRRIMKFLFDRCDGGVCITEGAVVLSKRCSYGALNCLIQHQRTSFTITEKMVMDISLSPTYGYDIPITKTIVENAIMNVGISTATILLGRLGCTFDITENIVKAAASNWKSGDEILELLFKQRGDEFAVTEEILKSAAENRYCGKQVINILLKQVEAAVKNEKHGEQIVRILLEQRGDEIVITEEILLASAENRLSSYNVMSVLLKERAYQITITEKIVKEVQKNSKSCKKVMKLLSQYRDRVTMTEEAIREIDIELNPTRDESVG
ncbi:hypothetical protein GGI43DRAFT_424472 [Trichoderma evansii]